MHSATGGRLSAGRVGPWGKEAGSAEAQPSARGGRDQKLLRLAVEGDKVGAVAGDPNDQSAMAVQIPERRLIRPLAAGKTW